VATGARNIKGTQAASLDPGGVQLAGSAQDRGGTVYQEPTQVRVGPQLKPPKSAVQGNQGIFRRPERPDSPPLTQTDQAESNPALASGNKQVLQPIRSRYLPDPETDPETNDISPQDPGKTVGSPSKTFAILARNIWMELRALRPQELCTLDGNSGGIALPANNSQDFYFLLSGKHVLATQVVVQNNTGATIYVELGAKAGLGSYALTTGNSYSPAVKASFVSIYTTTGTAVVNPNSTGGIIVRAWSNPEWSKMGGNL
jgi:hypothetical protein